MNSRLSNIAACPLRRAMWVMVWLLLVGAMTERSEAVGFLGLGDLLDGTFSSRPEGVSDDGKVVVGLGNSASGSEAFRWTSGGGMVGLGDLAGGSFYSAAYAVSADGSVVVGYSNSASGTEAFRWTSGGGMVGLGDLAGGSFSSLAFAVSADGSVVVGYSNSTSGNEAFRWTSGGGMVGLGDLSGGSISSEAYGVSADGSVVVGFGISASGGEAFRWTSGGGMVGLGDLSGGTFSSLAFSVSPDGSVVVGRGNSTSGNEAFRWTSGGGMLGLGDLAGGLFSSSANDVSADGSVVVGRGYTASGNEAFVWDATNGMRNLKTVLTSNLGSALNGWTLSEAFGVSADGQTVVGWGTSPSGAEAWVAYLSDQISWLPETSGAWDSTLNWSGPFVPGAADHVTINPTQALTITGPGTSQTTRSFTLGGSGASRATLVLSQGSLQSLSNATIHPDGELVLVDGRVLSAPYLFNFGLVRGTGTLNANLINLVGSEVRVAAGESLVVGGGIHSNQGRIEAIGGSVEFIGAVNNEVNTGLVTGHDATLRFQGGLGNAGSLSLTGGVNHVFGDISNISVAKIVVTGGAAVTFYDDITQNGIFRVSKIGSTTSVAVVLGAFTGAGGSTGGGDIFFEGDLRPGNSPAAVVFGNNISLGGGTTLAIELGGTTPGAQYDQVQVTGDVSLGGTLQVSLINSFMPVLGDNFAVLTFASHTGEFSTYSGLAVGRHLALRRAFTSTSLLLKTRPAIDGDINLDGTVNIFDINDVSAHWAQSGPAGDANGDGAVDIFDVNLISSNWGATGGSATAVPEPSAFILSSIGLPCLVALRWRRGR